MTIRVPILPRPTAPRVNKGKSVTFSWSAVTGASPYLLQVDDSTGFTVPLVLSQTTTARQFSNSSLAQGNLSWRVRAVDSRGTAGPWSTVRSLTVR